MTEPLLVDHIVRFLREVGLAVREEHLPANTFLPGLTIKDGTLVFDRTALLYPGDLLHEAGHLAVLPGPARQSANAEAMDAQSHAEESAIAWSYAAVRHLGLPADVLFHSGGYRGHAQGLVATFSFGVYPGLPGLEAAGLAVSPRAAAALGVAPYPAMLRWLRE
jgi:hypothetical protein